MPPASKAFTMGVRTNIVLRRQDFSWREIESNDYRTYIANLRAINCPEPTIRDIIVADVTELFARRAATEIKTPEQEWWRADPSPALDETAENKLRALEEERRALLTQLLGPDWETLGKTQLTWTNSSRLDGEVLGKLPAETKMSIHQMEARFTKLQADYLEARRKAGLEPEPAELGRQRKQMREQLAQLLTPAQMEEYLLRYSQTAHDLRRDLRGVQITPDEFRAVFRLRDPMDQQIDLLFSGTDGASVKQKAALEQQREAFVKQTLGPERYQLFKYLQDPIFREVRSSALEIGAPAEAVLPIYQITQATDQERARINSDRALTAEQRAAALEETQEEELKSLRKILGEEAFRRYRENHP